MSSTQIFLAHILTSIEALEKYTNAVSEEQFYINRQLQMACIKELEIIGEAVRNLPDDFRDGNPNIPWKDIAGMRSYLVHEYFEIDLDLVWDTIKSKIPELKSNIQKIFEPLQ